MSKQAWLTSCTPVKTARPDPRRGSRAIAIPPPTTGICGRYQLPVGGIREQYAHPSFLSIEIGVKLRRSPGHRSWSLSSRTASSSGRDLLNPDCNGPRGDHEFWLGDARKKEGPATRAGGAARERP